MPSKLDVAQEQVLLRVAGRQRSYWSFEDRTKELDQAAKRCIKRGLMARGGRLTYHGWRKVASILDRLRHET